MKLNVVPATLIVALLTACGEDPQPAPGSTPTPSGEAASPTDHGEATDLGTLTVAGREFGIVRLGNLEPGKESAFQVRPVNIPVAEAAALSLFLWVESQDGTQLSRPQNGTTEGDALHFHVMPRADEKTPFRVVLRLRADGTDERAGLPLDGHGHEHVEGPHQGIPATFMDGDTTRYLELKLHDDKGDLELWLAEDSGFTRPFDLPLDTAITVAFVDVQGRTATLRPRNRTRNEDEDGNPNIREGMTNYFIFPSQDGQDASWLMGTDFQSIVTVRFERDGQSYASREFVLTPHVH